MNIIDLIFFIALAVVTFLGFLGGIIKRIFVWGGLLLGFALAPVIGPHITSLFSDSSLGRFLTGSVSIMLCVLLFGLTGYILSKFISVFLPPEFKIVDRLGGAFLGALIVCALAWYTFPLMMSVGGGTTEKFNESSVAGFFTDLPDPPVSSLSKQIGEVAKTGQQAITIAQGL